MGPVAAQTSAPHLPPLQRPRLLHRVLVEAHREQAERHLEAPLVEAPPVEEREALLVGVLEGPQAQVALPELLRVRPEPSLEQCLP